MILQQNLTKAILLHICKIQTVGLNYWAKDELKKIMESRDVAHFSDTLRCTYYICLETTLGLFKDSLIFELKGIKYLQF